MQIIFLNGKIIIQIMCDYHCYTKNAPPTVENDEKSVFFFFFNELFKHGRRGRESMQTFFIMPMDIFRKFQKTKKKKTLVEIKLPQTMSCLQSVDFFIVIQQ